MKRTDQDGPITLGSLAWRFEIIEAEEDAGGAGEGIEEIPEPVKRDFNAASAEDLKGLPGIGPALAERIIARRRSAPFRSVDELIEVSGIGLKKLQELRPLVAVRMPWSCSTKTCQGCHWHLMAVTNRGRTIRAEGETAAAARLAAPERGRGVNGGSFCNQGATGGRR
jgi:competence ComEA-like helix-hairpin-helix protein